MLQKISYLARVLIISMKNFIGHPSYLLYLTRVLLTVDFFVKSSDIHDGLMSDRPFFVQHPFLKDC